MRTCSACGLAKPLDQFQPDAKKRAGVRDHCRACTTAYVREFRRKNAERYRAYWRLARTKNYLKEHARAVFNVALNRGKFKRAPCEICGAKAQAHHDDYSKPYAVRWLCIRHHREVHARQ